MARTSPAGARPGDLGWIVRRNAALYAAEHGWNTDYAGLSPGSSRTSRRSRSAPERVWIAELDGRGVGCVMCVRDEAPGAARLRLLLVEPDARGLGIGDRLLRACVECARGVGHREMVLWTNDVLSAARKIYQRHHFVLLAEKPHRSFRVDLVGQDWRLDLCGAQD